MRVVLVPVEREPEVLNVPSGISELLATLQQLVGGYIEPVRAPFGSGLCMYVNEIGVHTCPLNRVLPGADGGFSLFGDIVVAGIDCMTGDPRDLSDDEVAEAIKYFTDLEVGK